MKRILFISCLCAGLMPLTASATGGDKPTPIKPIHVSEHTVTGQPIELAHTAELRVSTYTLLPGKRLPTHKHPHQRLGFVLEGEVMLVNMEKDPPQNTLFKTGDFIIEMREQWHYGEASGNQTAKILVIDIMPPDTQTNVVLQNKVAQQASPSSTPNHFATTMAGQPIIMPREAEVRALLYEIGAQSSFPAHKHPYPRSLYILSGSVDVIDVESHEIQKLKTGDFVVEAVDRMHYGENNSVEPVKILVIDIVPVGAPSNTILQSQAN